MGEPSKAGRCSFLARVGGSQVSVVCPNAATIDNQFPLVVLKAGSVLMGLVLVGLAIRAYRKVRQQSFAWFAAALAVLTAGAFSEAVAYQGLCWPLWRSHIFEAVVTLVGFLLIVRALYVRR